MKIEEFKGQFVKGYSITPKGYALDFVYIETSFRSDGQPVARRGDLKGKFKEAVISCHPGIERILRATSPEDAKKGLEEALQKATELKDKLDEEHSVGKFAPK